MVKFVCIWITKELELGCYLEAVVTAVTGRVVRAGVRMRGGMEREEESFKGQFSSKCFFLDHHQGLERSSVVILLTTFLQFRVCHLELSLQRPFAQRKGFC